MTTKTPPEVEETARRQDDAGLPQQDKAWVATAQQAFAPEPLSANERAALRRKLDDRLARRRHGWWGVALAMAASVVLAAWMIWLRPPEPRDGVGPATPAVAVASDLWTEEVLFPEDELDDEVDDDELPDEYETLSMLF